MKRLSIFFLLASVSQLFGASGSDKKYQKHSPFMYAVLAEAAYKPSKESAQKVINELTENRSDMTVLDHKDYDSAMYGTTRLILVEDKYKDLHVAIDGTSSVRNAGRDIALLIRSKFAKYGVAPRVRNALHNIIKDWEHKPGKKKVTTVSGHSLGGAFASQVVNSHKKHYGDKATVITFNALKPVDRSNQVHFAIKHEHLSKLFSSRNKYIDLPSRGHHRLIRHHKLESFLNGLKGVKWDALLD